MVYVLYPDRVVQPCSPPPTLAAAGSRKRKFMENFDPTDDYSLSFLLRSFVSRFEPKPLPNQFEYEKVETSCVAPKDSSNDDAGLLNSNTLFPKAERPLGIQKLDECNGSDLAMPIKETASYQSMDSDTTTVVSDQKCCNIGDEDSTRVTICDHREYSYSCKSEAKDSKGLGVSLTDSLTAEQIKEHLHSLNPSRNVGENACQLCPANLLTFAAPPMDCACCGARIKSKLSCYTTIDDMGAHYYFCTLCIKKSHDDNISAGNVSFPKSQIFKGNYFVASEEAWVQCDKCEKWQHQICALYNSKLDLDGKMGYTCPICRLAELEAVKHVSVSPALGARDLRRTMLSDHIEKRLFTSLTRERKQRAELLGKSPEEVPGAEDLVVRVVLAADKQIKVKQQFLDILHGETYPSEFPYKSNVILLFQKVEGVEVCLFVMYVQEFGSECGQPNQRSVYISYLDSVKYFTPDVKTVTGEALRTFIYHEVLIGYLDHCKLRGFDACYIWACPPLKGDDYIFYSHPETQKTPKSDKLRKWYKKMLKKALKENVVMEYTNLYDHFFIPKENQNNSKITAARLPYFDGDYWTGAIEDMIATMEKDCGGDPSQKKKANRSMTRRTFEAMGHNCLSPDSAKDIQVMQKLGHAILPMKEDFIVVRLQFTCINCHEAMLSGNRWSCNQCSNVHLCTRCLEVEQSPDGLKTHTTTRGEKHILRRIPINDGAAETKDKDVILDNDVFEDRHAFLNFCQKNHYQFDTLRRAKHSSMMILYHLHKVPQNLLRSDSGLKSIEVQQQKTEAKKSMLDLLWHANSCFSTRENHCSKLKCLKVKLLFLHSRQCKVHLAGNCFLCKKIWTVLCLHSRYCQVSNCNFPRCMDLKKRYAMHAAQFELERRAAVTTGMGSIVNEKRSEELGMDRKPTNCTGEFCRAVEILGSQRL